MVVHLLNKWVIRSSSKVVDTIPNVGENLAYFYCNRDEDSRRQPAVILRTLILQLLKNKNISLQEHFCKKYANADNLSRLKAGLTCSECQVLLVEIADRCPIITICIDALDEVHREGRDQLLDALKYVMKQSRNPVKIFVTARMDIDIAAQLEDNPIVDIDPNDNFDDVKLFIEKRIRDILDRKLLQLSDSVSEAQVCSILSKKAKGM